MTKLLFLNKNLFFLISFVIFTGSLFFFFDFKDVIRKQQEKIHNIEVNRASKTVKTILPQIKPYLEDKISYSEEDDVKSKNISKLLSYYRNDEFKYIYLIYIDKKGAYRYLADGSQKNEKANLHQKFTPSLDNLWDRLKKEKCDVYDIQNNAEGLWLTYLSPIVKDGKIEAILVLDISTTEYKEFSKLIEPLDNFLNSFLFVLIIIIVIVTLQGILFYNQYKNSMIDSLTKLYNRHYLDTIYFNHIKKEVAIFMIDIDFFKLVNDTYGHDVGDIALASIAKKLLIATRLEDKVIRYGGEEFLVIVKCDKNVLSIAQRIRETVAKDSIRVNDKENIVLTVSIGVNLDVGSSISMQDAIDKADKALYLAKKYGRNRVEIYKNDK